MPSATSPSNGGDTAVFGTTFATRRPVVLDEWPELTTDDLDHTNGDAERLVVLVASATGHTRALVRQQLAELGQCAAPRAAAASLEERLVRLLDAPEGRSRSGARCAPALTCTLIARASLRRPILVETRKRLEDLERAYEVFAS